MMALGIRPYFFQYMAFPAFLPGIPVFFLAIGMFQGL